MMNPYGYDMGAMYNAMPRPPGSASGFTWEWVQRNARLDSALGPGLDVIVVSLRPKWWTLGPSRHILVDALIA